MPEGAIYVGRPSRWGNPFIVGQATRVERYYPSFAPMIVTPRNHAEAADWFSLTMGHDWALPAPARIELHSIRAELRGRDLACWCPLEDEHGNRFPCHADVLLAVANA